MTAAREHLSHEDNPVTPAAGASTPLARVAVIGAGASGLACARQLHEHGVDVSVFDKGRRVGGRLATRVIWREGELDGTGFDHGAQYFTARHAVTRELVESWKRAGVLARWDVPMAELNSPGVITPKDARDAPERYVGVPSMQSLAQHMARDLQVHTGVQVTRVDSARRLYFEEGEPTEPFDFVIVSAPAAQAAALLEQLSSGLAAELGEVAMQPCWAAMVVFERAVGVEADGLFINLEGSNALSWAARDASKQGRDASLESWVLHASQSWSTAHLGECAVAVIRQLQQAFFEALGRQPVPARYARAHRWRYARGSAEHTPGARWDFERGAGICGDWLAGGRVEGALLSGHALAAQLLEHLAAPEREQG